MTPRSWSERLAGGFKLDIGNPVAPGREPQTSVQPGAPAEGPDHRLLGFFGRLAIGLALRSAASLASRNAFSRACHGCCRVDFALMLLCNFDRIGLLESAHAGGIIAHQASQRWPKVNRRDPESG